MTKAAPGYYVVYPGTPPTLSSGTTGGQLSRPLKMDFDAIIAGAGHNGLVSACYLARAGLRVLVLDRRAEVGGACSTEELFPGYHFSSCSYLCYLLQDQIIRDLDLRNHGFEVLPIDPWRFLPLPDGNRLLIWNDDERTREEIARFSKQDAANYPAWNAFWCRAAGILHPWFLKAPPSIAELRQSLKSEADRQFFDELRGMSMKQVVTRFFESNAVQAAFIHAHDVGDVSAPGSAWAYAYIKCTMFSAPENVGLVKGGMGGITQALASVAESLGVFIRTNSDVQQILVEGGKAIGVRLSDGTEFRSRVVLSNADPKRTFLKLVAGRDLPAGFADRIGQLKTKAAYFKFHAALKGVPDFSRYFTNGNPAFDPKVLAEVKICPSIAYFEKAWNDACLGEPARHPVMEVQMPSAYDPSVAPAGCHVLSIWGLYAPVHPARGDWNSLRAEAAGNIISTLTKYAPNFRDILVDHSLFTPADLEQRVGLTDGNIRHLDMIPDQMLDGRPMTGWAGYRTPIQGLYLCGGGTHPGGEVTGAPGHNAAKTVINDM